MANADSRFVDVTCENCGVERSIRLDQYTRRGKTWRCRSCAYKGRESARKGKGVKNDPALKRTSSSFYKARYRCRTGHGGYYANVEFKFNSFWEIIDEIGLRPEGKTLDRINNQGHYEPGNIRWATPAEQNRNRRGNVMLEYNGEMLCMTDAAKISGIPYGTLEGRLKAGCPPSHLFIKGRWRNRNGALAPLPQSDE